jgi:hypothetical protein
MRTGLVVLLLLAPLAAAADADPPDPLPVLTLDRDSLSVSGISSGAFTAHQFHLAHSAAVVGVGMIAGGPYACAKGTYGWSRFDVTGLYVATSICSNTNPLWFFQGPPDPAQSVGQARNAAAAGRIDDLANLDGDRVWLLSGRADRTVPTAVMDTVDAVYRSLGDSDITYQIIDDAQHAMITDDFGNPCSALRSPFINDCDVDAAGAMLAHIYGPLAPKMAETDLRPLLAFDQHPYVDGTPGSISLADVGYLYVPEACAAGESCRLHIALHGCQQYAGAIGDAFTTGAGYNEWAESNRIVVLYPQTTATGGWFSFGVNPSGCWDWWGYTGPDFASRDAPQIRALARMADALSGDNRLASPAE